MTTIQHISSFSLALLAGALALGACGDGSPTGNADLDRSLAAWHAFRDDAHGNYVYSRLSLGAGDEPNSMVFTIEDNQVVSREYVPYSPSEGEGWIESGAELGSHDEGPASLTLDEIYDLCATDYVVRDPAEYTVTLDFFDNHLLRLCEYSPLYGDGTSGSIEILEIEASPST